MNSIRDTSAQDTVLLAQRWWQKKRVWLIAACISGAAVASALQRLINNPEFAQRMAARGKRHVEKNFSMARMCRAYRKLFRV